jgi:hypothetical protein
MDRGGGEGGIVKEGDGSPMMGGGGVITASAKGNGALEGSTGNKGCYVEPWRSYEVCHMLDLIPDVGAGGGGGYG